MLNALKRLFGFRPSDHSGGSPEPPLFSGSAYFSSRVPSVLLVAHGGEISSGTTLDIRARYFFAIDPSEPWVTKLFAKSVMVFHAGWIAHCAYESFQVPIAEYILDDRFVPEPPYKLTCDFVPPIYVPLSGPGEPIDARHSEYSEPGLPSDTPSTPTSMPRKRKREQAYFDSPSGFLVFSGFNKDGMPRRPRKQRKLRFDPSFSPGDGRPDWEAMSTDLDWLRDHHDALKNDDEINGEPGQGGKACALRGHLSTERSPDTPDKPLANVESSAIHRLPSVDEHLPKSIDASSPAVSIVEQERSPPVRTIDFTNLPPRTRRWRFPNTDDTKSSTVLSVVKATDHKVKTPKKISFADHARVCVYTVSPQRPDLKDSDGVGVGSARQPLNEGLEDGLNVNGETQVSSDQMKTLDNSTTQANKASTSRANSPKVGDDTARVLDEEDQSENDTLTLTVDEVQAMRYRLLGSAEKNGVDDGQLATLFELGKTFRDMTFHHIW